MRAVALLLIALLAVFVLSATIAPPSDKMWIRLWPGRDARITVWVPQRPEHRSLVITGVVINEEMLPIWERSSGVELDGDRAKRTHVFEWRGLPFGQLEVRADSYGLCGSVSAAGFVR